MYPYTGKDVELFKHFVSNGVKHLSNHPDSVKIRDLEDIDPNTKLEKQYTIVYQDYIIDFSHLPNQVIIKPTLLHLPVFFFTFRKKEIVIDVSYESKNIHSRIYAVILLIHQKAKKIAKEKYRKLFEKHSLQ